MTKQQILKKTGLSEKEFYKQFPTKESWEMYANGGQVKMYADGGKLPEGILRSRLESHMSPSEAQSYIDSYGRGGVVDVYQLMGMPTPAMYGKGSKIHPTLTFSAENNTNPNFQPVYSSNPYYNKTYSVNNRNTLAGTFPIVNNRLNLTGSYSDANDGTYTAGAALNVGDLLSGAGGKGPSRRYDNPDIAHRGRNSFINTYGHARAGITNKGDKIFPYWGFDVTAAHQMGRVKGPNGLRQPKGTIYASGEFNNVEDPLNAIYENDNYMRANLGGSYNFGKGLGVYGEAGYDLMRKAPRAEIGLKKTFEYGGSIDDTPDMYGRGGGIHIKPSKRGTFTAAAKKHGKSVQAFASQVLANKENYSPAMVKKANFARNAAKWKHEDGGPVDYTPSYAFGNVQSKNTTYNHGFGYGGMIPMYGGGGFLDDVWTGVKDVGISAADNTLSIVNPDIIKESAYSDTGFGDKMKAYSSTMGTFINKAAPAAANIILPGSGMAISAAQNIGGNFVEGDPERMKRDSVKIAQSVGQLGSMATSFMNPLQAASGAANAAGGASNIATASGSMPMFAAMGGQVNYPQGLRKNMGNMPIFAEGGMTDNLTQINVEKGELLTDKNGKIVTEYRGGGMVPHPEEGMDERGTVPAQEGMFVITKAKAESYKNAMKNNDKVYADSIRNNIAFDKARKEAKEEAAANAAYNKFAKKYGGAIQRMYAKGGMIPMYYDGAGVTGGLNSVDWSNIVINNPAFKNNYSFDVPTTTFSGSMEFPNVPSSLNLDSSPMTMAEYRGQTGSYMNPANIPNTGIGYKGSNTSTPPPNFNLSTLKDALPYGVAASQVLEPLLQRPYRMDASKYETPTDLKWRELTGERGRRDMQGAYNLAKYNARQIGGSGILPALTSTAGRYFDSLAAYNEALENKNRLGQSEIDRANKAIQQANFAQRMQIDQFNEQNRAARRNAIRQGVMNLAGTYYNQDASQMTKQGLSAAYPDYVFPWSAKTKKTKS